MRSRVSVRARLAAALALGVLALGACAGDGRPAARELAGTVREPPLAVGDVALPDVSAAGRGEPFAMRAPDGGLLVVYFGYTSCPDLCPTTLADIGAALRAMPATRDRVEVVMVTIDPARDRPAVMNSFLDHFVEGGHALRTRRRADLDRAMAAFRAWARPSGDGGFEHTTSTYAVDDRGTVVLEWPFGISPDDLRADLDTLLDRQDQEEQR